MVKAWKEQIVIPTYRVGEPEKNPIFLENRVYQGSSGRVYPYPVIEKVSDTATDHTYNAVWIENEYIRVMVLPELGGRIQMAYDKIKQRHFVYYNHVIKPALVGLAGPWISGGIEFNWPQHHRPSTFMPIDSTIEENADGSVTVWVGEMERMTHQKALAGFTLRPGCAYLEIKGRAINRTPIPQTFLWWANPAVKVNDHYQSVFPQDVNAVFDHGKRAVTDFPIATGTYYKMDYSAGVDISNYKNIKVPTSYMAVNSKFDFEGGYENDTRGGMLHVASRHVSPGKKQWTWGNGDFGRAWDRNLTDTDGPYIELMAGVYTENQPDFSWLQPYEEKMFTQYFMPYRDLGLVKNASRHVIMNITPEPEGMARLQLLATSAMEVEIKLTADSGETIYRETACLSPEEVAVRHIACADISAVTVSVCRTDRFATRLLSWHAEPDEIRPVPPSAEAALRPEEIATTEQLYLTGLHLEQYRHATFRPTDYYEEALRRDPNDVRCNNAMGLWLIRNAQPYRAMAYLRRAVGVLQRRNPNPYDGEPIYNLALSLMLQDCLDEAYTWFNKATWNAAWADAAFYNCAAISTRQGRYYDALEEIGKCLTHNSHNHQARALKAALLRTAGRYAEAAEWIAASVAIDPFNYGCMFEQYKVMQATGADASAALAGMTRLMRRCEANYEELMSDFCHTGLWAEAVELAEMACREGIDYPMIYYLAAWAESHVSDNFHNWLAKAEAAPMYLCFPNSLTAALALKFAIDEAGLDADKCGYYLGCLYYDKRQYDEAIDCWTLATDRNPQHAAAWRCLALAKFNKKNSFSIALEYMERAFAIDTTDARIFMELDQLRKRLQTPHERRLEAMQRHHSLVEQRDDLLLEEATLLNQTGQYRRAMELIDSHIFHPWEGGEGKVPAQYQTARVELAKKLMAEGNNREAIALLTQCLEYPHHLGEGKLYGAQENDFYYLLGMAHHASGHTDEALACWTKGTEGPTEPAPALYYNDAKPDKIFYAALCHAKLGNADKANGLWYKLVTFGKNHIFDKVRMDYFAVSLPDLQIWNDSLDRKNRLHCTYMLALGYTGLGDTARARRFMDELKDADINHQGIIALQSLIDYKLI